MGRSSLACSLAAENVGGEGGPLGAAMNVPIIVEQHGRKEREREDSPFWLIDPFV